MKIVLPNERPMGLNKLISSHWRIKDAEARRVHMEVWLKARLLKSTDKPKHITTTVYFSRSPLDCDNILDKFYIDGLRKANILKDDSMEYVVSATTISKVDKENPRVEIDIIDID